MANLIQIKRSATTDAPTTLQPGELAYSLLNTSNSLFVGDGSNNAIRIGGGKYLWLHQANTATPGALAANAVVILNANGYTVETRTNKLIVGADGTTINISSINATSNSTVLGGNSNTELPTSYAVQYYVEQKTSAIAGAVSNNEIVFSNNGVLAGNSAFAFYLSNNTVSATGNLEVGGTFELTGTAAFGNTTESANTTYGAVTIAGGLGVAKKINTKELAVGSPLGYSAVNATAVSTGDVFATGTVNASTLSVGNWVVANNSGVFTSGVVNADIVSVGTAFKANTSQVTATVPISANNTAAFGNTTINGFANITSTLFVSSDIGSNGSLSLQGANVDIEVLQGGAHLGLTNYLMVATANVNNYAQIGLQNKGAGDNANASADFVAYPPGPHANDQTGFVDMGITGNSFSQAAYSVTQGFEGYVFASALAGSAGSGSLVLATDSTGTNNSIRFYTNGFNQSVTSAAMIIDRNQRIGIANMTPSHTLSLGGTMAVSGNATFSNVISVTGNATFSNSVSIAGNLSLSSNIEAQYANIVVDTRVGGNISVEGNAILGSNDTDTVAINGKVNTHIIPSHNQQRDLGNTTNEWRTLRVQDAYVSRDLSVSGNLVVSGTLTTINSTDINISDPMIRVANGNLTTDLVDVGIFGSFGNSTVIQYSGLFRDASNGGRYKLFTGNIPEPGTTVDTSNSNFAYADLQVNTLYANVISTANAQITGGSITGITALVVPDGGTGVSVFANNGIIYGQNTSALAVTSAGVQGEVLQAGSGGVPQFATLDGGTF